MTVDESPFRRSGMTHRPHSRMKSFVDRRWAVAFVAALGACGPSIPPTLDPPPLPAGVTSRVIEETYPVVGRTVNAISASMVANGPTWQGERAWGLARWSVRWQWRSTEHGVACQLADVRVMVSVHMTLPEWHDAERAPAELRVRWNEFSDALRIHEYGHRDRAFLAGNEVHDVLLALRTRDCLDMPVHAETQARKALLRHQKLDDEYERSTLRGWAQGATWPPGSGP